jgi:cytochrome oxidase Cu insertion factor (SCO1/SenC/PrrC family)
LAGLQPDLFGRGAKLVSISSDAEFDRPEILRPYARKFNASPDWFFLTGDEFYIQRVGSEFLGLSAHSSHHSSQLAVVDRWGNVRARLDWQNEATRQLLLDLVEKLNLETEPVADFDLITSKVPEE